jgi:dipeptidyl aminopeptidase/acylaminoacyl peptidase
MGSVLLPPRELEPSPRPAADPEALIEEARQRRWRRRLWLALLTVAVAGLAALVFGLAGRGSNGTRPRVQSSPAGLFVDRAAFAGHGELAFVSLGGLFVLDGATGDVTSVATRDRDVSDPQFSPNGEWLSYTLGNDNVGLARADGSDPRTVLAARFGSGGARWLPDSRLVVGNRILRIAASGEPKLVATAPSELAAWSPDGTRYAFVSRSVRDGRNGSFRGVERLQVAGSLTGTRTTWLSNPISFTRKRGFEGNAINRVVVLPHRQGILFWLDPF